MKKIIFITGSKGKVASMRNYLEPLGFEIENHPRDLIEPQYDNLNDIAHFKAKEAFKEFKQPLVVVDSGFFIPKLNNFPGPYAKYINETIGAEGILSLVDSINPEDRNAYYKNHLCFIKNENEIYDFEEKYLVTIADKVIESEHSQAWSVLWKITVPLGAPKNQVLGIMPKYNKEEYDYKARPDGNVWNKFAKFLSATEVVDKD